MSEPEVKPNWKAISERIEFYKAIKKAILDESIDAKTLVLRAQLRDRTNAQLKEDLHDCINHLLDRVQAGETSINSRDMLNAIIDAL